MARASSHAARQLNKTRGILPPQDLLRRNLAPRQLGERQGDPPSLAIRSNVAQDVGQLQRLAQVNGVVPAGRIPVAKHLDAEQPHDGGHAVAIQFELLVILIPIDVEVHFDTQQQRVKMVEGQAVLPNDRLQLAVDRELWSLRPTGPTHVLTPGRQLFAPALG